ncbi:MAG: TIGR00366 family protein [Spirochaetia bacterium]|jgi:uncharacterized ion transporter superfamily protein YfcC|nr:TIGR00366 family protein [Spirochaetia bacterium]
MQNVSAEKDHVKKKKEFSLPDTIVILLALTFLATVLTYIIPAGKFDMVKNAASGRDVVDPATFHFVEQRPVSILDMFAAVPKGLIQTANIMVLTLFCGAVFHLVTHTGAMDAGLAAAMKKLSGSKKYILVVGMMLVSSVLGLRGSAETLLPFMPLAVSTCIVIGLDSLAGAAIILVGAAAGMMNSFISHILIVAQGIAELPPYSGIGVRVISYAAFWLVAALFIILYCKKLDKDPTRSSMYEQDRINHKETVVTALNAPEFTTRRKVTLITFGVGMLTLIACLALFTFNVAQVSTLYFILALIIGIVGGYSPNTFAKEFINGCRSMLYGAMIVGFARAISIVMTDGVILDTITNVMASILKFLPSSICAVGMLFVQGLMSIVVPSGTGQAAVTMPLIAPLADLIGVTRQTSVVAFMLGDGIINLLTPTSGYFMAAIGIVGISWLKWVKWYIPLAIIWIIMAIVVLIICTMIGYGPF